MCQEEWEMDVNPLSVREEKDKDGKAGGLYSALNEPKAGQNKAGDRSYLAFRPTGLSLQRLLLMLYGSDPTDAPCRLLTEVT